VPTSQVIAGQMQGGRAVILAEAVPSRSGARQRDLEIGLGTSEVLDPGRIVDGGRWLS